MKTGIELIAAERQRQVSKEGWTPEHDDEHKDGALAMAGAAYAWYYAGCIRPKPAQTDGVHSLRLWPWHPSWWKPRNNDPIRNLVRAGALIAAEIDRLQRIKDAQP